jgi:hypothetical protein
VPTEREVRLPIAAAAPVASNNYEECLACQ